MFIIAQDYVSKRREVEFDDYTEEYAESLKEECTDDNVPTNKDELYEFLLLDDDTNVYFRGFSDDDSSFEPLDWAMGEYGCTGIMYKTKDGEWRYL